jgi:hypothetical protein
MSEAAKIVTTLRRFGRPSAPKAAIAAYVTVLDWTLILLPLAAALWRRSRGADLMPLREGLGLLAAALLVPGLVALARVPWRRGDPLAAARALDAGGGRQRFVTAAECALRGYSTPFALLLQEVVALDLERLPGVRPPAVRLRLPSLLRGAIAIVLAFLILVMPSFGSGARPTVRAVPPPPSSVDGSTSTRGRIVRSTCSARTLR